MSESRSGLIDMAPDIYRGLNPAFVRKVWAKRRAERGMPSASLARVPSPITKPQRKWTAADRKNVVQMMDEGLTRQEIARRLGRTKDSVEAFVKRMRASQTTGR